MFQIAPAAGNDALAIDDLLDRAFGPGRLGKTSYRYRQLHSPVPGLGFVARKHGAVVGSIAFWPVTIGDDAPALLLGPLAVDPALQHGGIGRALVEHSLDKATAMGHRIVVLVGDPVYYARFGFVPAAPYGIVMAGEDPGRLQVRSLAAGALAGIAGPVLAPSLETPSSRVA